MDFFYFLLRLRVNRYTTITPHLSVFGKLRQKTAVDKWRAWRYGAGFTSIGRSSSHSFGNCPPRLSKQYNANFLIVYFKIHSNRKDIENAGAFLIAGEGEIIYKWLGNYLAGKDVPSELALFEPEFSIKAAKIKDRILLKYCFSLSLHPDWPDEDPEDEFSLQKEYSKAEVVELAERFKAEFANFPAKDYGENIKGGWNYV